MRAIAILLVVAYHARLPGVSGGFVGVDVFFVISGFLITGILTEEAVQTGSVSLLRFWARRARRILPAAALVTIITLLVAIALAGPTDLRTWSRTGLYFAAYASNVLFVQRETDYFGEALQRDPLLHTWSLTIEEQFYLFFAPAFAFVVWGARGQSGVFLTRLRLAVAVVVLLTFVGCVVAVQWRPVAAFYLLPTRFWELGVGSLLGLGAFPVLRTRQAATFAASLGLLMMAAAAVTSADVAHPSWFTLLPVVGTAALIMAGTRGPVHGVSAWLGTAPLRWLGQVSYSWYLWHWPALVVLAAAVPGARLGLRLTVAIATLLPASATYYLIERRIRNSAWLIQRPAYSVFGGIMLGAVMAGSALIGMRVAEQRMNTRAYDFIEAARALPRLYADGCHADVNVIAPPSCVYGATHADTVIYLFGDSHAAQWFPALEVVALRRGWQLVPLTKTGCSFADVRRVDSAGMYRYPQCQAWRDLVLKQVESERPTAVIVTSSHPPYSPSAAAAWEAAVLKTLRRIESAGVRAIVLDDPLSLVVDPMPCIERNYRDSGKCVISPKLADIGTAVSTRRAAARVSGTRIISLREHLCESRICRAVRDGMVVYRDDNHLAVPYVNSLAPILESALVSALATGPSSCALSTTLDCKEKL